MSKRISFVTANYVAGQVGYRMTGGWRQGEEATNEYMAPLDTFAGRFEEILRDVRAMGFEAIEIWTAHLHWRWATDGHVATARDLLSRHNLPVASLAGWFGETREQFEAACRLAQALDTHVLAGMTSLLAQDREALIDALKAYDVRFAYENHPEKTPEETLAKIGGSDGGWIGTTVDTGNYGNQGGDALRAIEELGDRILHVHLKDVLAPGSHATCRYGRGCVPVEACVRALKEMGYSGYYSVEHEPADYDPTEDCRANLSMVRQWLEA